MKIKVNPEDFVVREEIDPALTDDGPYRVYLLHKRGWNTLDAIRAGARASGVPVHEVRHGGLKDRHAVTSQYVSVPNRYTLKPHVPGIPDEDLRFEPLGFSGDFVSTRNLTGNTFELTVRSLSDGEMAVLGARLAPVRENGFPNYFDDQRFGSVPPGGEFLAERVLKGHLKGALRLYLAAESPSMPAREKERRLRISEAWGDWEAVAVECQSGVERRIVESLKQGGNKKNLLAAINAIPHDEMAMYLAALQAVLWNQTLRRLLTPVEAGSMTSVPGRVGDYLFPAQCGGEDTFRRLQGISIPTVARRILPCPPEVTTAIDAVLEERQISMSDLNLRGIRTAYLKSFYRSAVVIPMGLLAGGFLPDELYAGRKKVSLSFSLPRGSYATMLLKALTVGTAAAADESSGAETETGIE